MIIGLVGKPSSGKSTLFSALTLIDVPRASYPFTTIEPNEGVTYVRAKCACTSLGVRCSPKHGKCEEGIRFIPVKLTDVAGLVPGAHEGRGRGNKFLDDLRQADALIHIVDLSGSTDSEGNMVDRGSHDPAEDIAWLEEEINMWIYGLLEKDWSALYKRIKAGEKARTVIHEKLAGLGISEDDISFVLKDIDLEEENGLRRFAEEIRKMSKPMLIAANKADIAEKQALDRLRQKFSEKIIIPTSAESELALRKAASSGAVEYSPGDPDFKIVKELSEEQKKGLEFIRENVMKRYGGTGVQDIIDKGVFRLLDLIVVYPVADQNKYTDQKGAVLPDAYLVSRGTTAKQLAYRIHSDFGKNFIGAVDARTKKKLGENYELKDGDVIKIISGA